MKDSMLEKLNPAQREAVATNSGPLLVLAGAGTGKTRVVTFRIARLISKGIKPPRILAVTFTNKAAGEMQERIGELIGKRDEDDVPEISTFHSLCVRILRRQIDKLGYPKTFTIYDSSDQDSVARRVLREVSVPTSSLQPRELLFHISQWKSKGIGPQKASSHAVTDKEHLAAACFRRYQGVLKTSAAVDFDDLLLLTEQLFASHQDARTAEAARFDHILVDEYQDTNATQYRIIKSLASAHRNLCVVGDDDQSIYGWRGAEVEHILRFRDDWKEAKVVRLEENYRSTDAILSLANRLIRYNKVRHDKTLRAARPGGEKPKIRQFPTEADEAKQVVADISRRIQDTHAEPNDFAILFRTNEQTRAFETELRSQDIPYVLIGGMSFFDRKEVRDMLAYFRLVVTPEDEPALMRVLNTPPRGIGDKAREALLHEAVKNSCPAWNVLSKVRQLPDFSSKAADSAIQFMEMIKRYQTAFKKGSLVDTANQFIREIGYEQEIKRTNPDDVDAQESRWNAVQELVNALGEYEGKRKRPSMQKFLDSIALAGREMERDKDKQLKRNAVVLMTLHAAKGLEFPEVYMVGIEEGILPHHRSINDGDNVDEERRLCYVGITRAQERLTLSFPLTRRKWGKARDTKPSRFLFELTGQADNPHAGPPAHHLKTTAGNKKTVSAGQSKAGHKKKTTAGSSKPAKKLASKKLSKFPKKSSSKKRT